MQRMLKDFLKYTTGLRSLSLHPGFSSEMMKSLQRDIGRVQGTDTLSHSLGCYQPDHPSADFTQFKAELLRHPYPAQLSCHSLLLA